ncbi:MAG: hypothetical protein JSR77_17375 [Planctomycetes bacterium]|nr:hypothetical protein [Planctomycetota bacterium]
MRLPAIKVYRAFRAFDHMPDGDCERYVRRVRANAGAAHAVGPLVAAFVIALAWFIGWPFAATVLPLSRYIPLPDSAEMQFILLVATGALAVGVGSLIIRDGLMYEALRRELARTDCRKCGQSLLGVPISRIGVDPDPAKSFIKCPECGRKFCLLDIGLAPHDLVPLEQRHLPKDLATIRRRVGA